MKTRVSEYDFVNAFDDADRSNQFSREARFMLFDYFEQYEMDTNEEIELDVIAICCDYAEATPEDIANDYGIDISECEDEVDIEITVIEYLGDRTSVVGVTDNGTIVYQQF